MPDKAAFVNAAYSLTAVTRETSNVSSPTLKRHLLADNGFAFLISPSKKLSLGLGIV